MTAEQALVMLLVVVLLVAGLTRPATPVSLYRDTAVTELLASQTDQLYDTDTLWLVQVTYHFTLTIVNKNPFSRTFHHCNTLNIFSCGAK